MTRFKRIATEEAWTTPDILDRYRKLLATQPQSWDPGFHSLWGFWLGASERARALQSRLQDLGERRLRDMDASGIDVQLLMLTAPGVQVFDAPTAASLCVETNDRLAAAVRENPARYAGMAAIAPQDPAGAARELERAVGTLGLKGAVINSHTRGEYLDDPKFWEIFEAAESLNVPIYIHPQAPPPAMIGPYVERGLEGALWGFGAETGLHVLAIIRSGALDRFPRLRLVVGHLGEALPFWLYRLDYMNKTARPGIRTGATALARPISDYMKENVYITTSGMAWAPAITFVQSVIGVDRVMYAMDYPYQFELYEVDATDDMAIGDDEKKRLFQTNAEAVFSLTPG